jgi:hypothetical protein
MSSCCHLPQSSKPNEMGSHVAFLSYLYSLITARNFLAGELLRSINILAGHWQPNSLTHKLSSFLENELKSIIMLFSSPASITKIHKLHNVHCRCLLPAACLKISKPKEVNANVSTSTSASHETFVIQVILPPNT